MKKYKKANKRNISKTTGIKKKTGKKGKNSSPRLFMHIGIAVCFLAIVVLAIIFNNSNIDGKDRTGDNVNKAADYVDSGNIKEVTGEEDINTEDYPLNNITEAPTSVRWRADKNTLVIRLDESDTISCTRNGEDAEVEWYSDDDSIAYTNGSGVIYAIASGFTYVNAVYDEETVLTVPVHINREALPPLKEPESSRFSLEDSIYINPDAEQTNKATLMFVGDLMCVSEMQRQAIKDGTYDFNAGFDYVKPIIEKADLTVGNLETTLSHTAPYKHEQNRIMGARRMQHNCNAPSTFLDAVRYAGFDAVVNAHNHSLDAGIQGIKETIDHLQNYNIQNTGTFVKADDQRFLLYNINGINIAILSYATTFNTFDEFYTYDELETHVNFFTKEKAERDIDKAKNAGAEYVFVYMHWGSQNSTEVTDSQISYGQELAEAGADFILGNHPHVLNRFDLITTEDSRSVPVIYSLGNFFTDMNEVENLNSDSVILKIDLMKDTNGLISIEYGYIPCFILIDYNGLRNITLPCDIDIDDLSIAAQLEQARERIKTALGDMISEVRY